MRQFIKKVSRIVTAQAGQCCSCKFPLEDEYGKYQGYKSHDNWEVWSQEHDAWGWQYFLKCLFCDYELARQYWNDLDGTFVDYTDGLAEEQELADILDDKEGYLSDKIEEAQYQIENSINDDPDHPDYDSDNDHRERWERELERLQDSITHCENCDDEVAKADIEIYASNKFCKPCFDEWTEKEAV